MLDPKASFNAYSSSPFVVTGVLDVGLEFRDGFLESVYRMKATHIKSAY